MSASKAKYEYQTILDFTSPKISKNSITQKLRQTNFSCSYLDEHTGSITRVEHEVKVRMFKIHLILSSKPVAENFKNLRNYGKFYIKIYQLSHRGNKEINLVRDKLFKNQYWVHKNFTGWLKIKDLINVILFCNKINKLKVFL